MTLGAASGGAASGGPEEAGGAPIPVEVLHTAGCGRWEAARGAVLRVAEEQGITVTVSARLVDDAQAARELRFLGSPTVRVRGRDVQPEADERDDFGLG